MKLDPDLALILKQAGIEPEKATDMQIALADRMYQLHTKDGRTNHGAAADALWRRLNN